MKFFWWREKPFKMVWRVERDGPRGFLVGTAHFFPASLRKPLTRLIQAVETVVFEGPLDEASMARVAKYGRKPGEVRSLDEALDPGTIQAINKEFWNRFVPSNSAESVLPFIQHSETDFVELYIRGVRPWMAFFTLWSMYLNWKYSIDMEAFQIARKLGQEIRFLETIDEQLAAMDGIPLERIADYVNRFDQWKSYRREFLNHFLEGDLEKLMSRTPRFPTRCESIFGIRDSRFFERMIGFYETGTAVAFLGMSHIPTIKTMFLNAGYSLTQTVA